MAIKQAKSSKLANLLSDKRLLVIAPILLFAVIGAYVVFQSKAATTARVYFDSTQASVGHAVGSTYDLKVYVDMPTPPAGVMYMRVFAQVEPSDAQYTGLDCGVAGPCDTPIAGEGPNGPDRCIKVDASKFGSQGVKVFTLHYTSLSSGAPHLRLGADWWTNPCGSSTGNQLLASDQGSNLAVRCGEHTDWVVCATGPDETPAIQQSNKVNNTQATNQGKKGGGSGGSSSTTQSQQESTVPSSTGQGEQTQTAIEPSPFFDGKQYDPGSDPDILGVNTTFSVAGHNLKYGRLFILLVLIAAGLTYYLWKKPRWLSLLRQLRPRR